jgi:hypothetical protein
MIPASTLAVGSLDFIERRVFRDAKDFVWIQNGSPRSFVNRQAPEAHKNRERRAKAARSTPAKGRSEQRKADAPLSGGVRSEHCI